MASLLRNAGGALSSIASGVPKAAGQAAAAASAAPQMVSSASESVNRRASSIWEGARDSKLGGVKPSAGLKAASEFTSTQFNPELAGQWLRNFMQNSLGSSVQVQFDTTNEVLSALGLPVWIVRSSTVDAKASVRVVQEVAKDSEPARDGLTPRQFIRFMHEARRSENLGGGLQRYIHSMIDDGRLKHIPLLPNAFELKLYEDVARLMIYIWHHAFKALDSASFWGHQLQVTVSPALPVTPKKKVRQHVGEAQIGLIVDKMLESAVVNMVAVPDFIEKRLYVNCIMVVLQLIDDLVTGQGEEVVCMGHALRFSLERQPINLLKQLLRDNPVKHCQIDEGVLLELTDELLSDDDVNLQWMPDIIERQIYKSVLRLMIRVMEEIVCRVKMKMLGRDIDVQILGAADVKAYQASNAAKPEAVLYFAEEDPLKTVSSTELEERLKHIDEQRRILEAIKELGGAEFDMTAEKPMVQHQRKADQTGAQEPLRATGETKEAVEADEVHEFQRLAHTLKLGRALHTTCVVEADINVPWKMIADVETYPDWMPWCTSGKMLGEKHEGQEPREAVCDGEVGFGIDTGSFLGTMGDQVFYRITTVEPAGHGATTNGNAEDDEASTATAPPLSAKVLADAVNGFAYGERLAYDWRFQQVGPKTTKVELDVLFQAKSVLYMPLWDSMQNMIMSKMLQSFKSRAEVLQREQKS